MYQLQAAAYAAVNCLVLEHRLRVVSLGSSEGYYGEHDDDYTEYYSEYCIARRNGCYNTQTFQYFGEREQLTEWSEGDDIDHLINQLSTQMGCVLWLIEIGASREHCTRDYVAVVGCARELYTFACHLQDSKKIISGIVSTDGFWEAGKQLPQDVMSNLPATTAQTVTPTREQSMEMNELAHKLNNYGQTYHYYDGSPIAVEEVVGVLGTYYKYPKFDTRFKGGPVYIVWELEINRTEAESCLQAQQRNLKYLA